MQERAKRKFSVYEGDHLTLLNIYKAFIRVTLPLPGVLASVLSHVIQFNKDSRWCHQHFLNYKG